jgi:hypothetical protein
VTRPDVVVIYGNCQAQFLRQLVSETPSLRAAFTFLLVTNTVEPGELPSPIPEEVARAVLFWEQYDQRSDIGLRDEVLRRIPRGCPVVRYPAVGMNAFWPFRVRDKRNRIEPDFPWGRYPSGDRIAMEIVPLGLPASRAFERYMELSASKMPDVRHLLDLERSVYARRDAGCDIGMRDFIFAGLRSTYQFWTHGHLAVSVFSELVFRLLERSRDVFGNAAHTVRAELEALSEIFPGQGEVQLPLHPLVIRQLGLTFADERTRYRWFGNEWTFEEYMLRYLTFDRSWQPYSRLSSTA